MAKRKNGVASQWIVGVLLLSVLLVVVRGQRGKVMGDHEDQGQGNDPTPTVIWVSPAGDMSTPTPTPTGETILITPPAAPTATPEPTSSTTNTESQTQQSGGFIQNVINSFSGQSAPTPTSYTPATTVQTTSRTTVTPKKTVEEPTFKAELVKTQLDLAAEKIGNLKKVGLTVPGLAAIVDGVIEEHNDFSQRVDAEIVSINSRPKIIKWLLGPDYRALKALNRLIATNAKEIKTLQDLLFKVSNQNDIDSIKAAVEAIKEENLAIQEQITAESNLPSLFGFAMNYIAK